MSVPNQEEWLENAKAHAMEAGLTEEEAETAAKEALKNLE